MHPHGVHKSRENVTDEARIRRRLVARTKRRRGASRTFAAYDADFPCLGLQTAYPQRTSLCRP